MRIDRMGAARRLGMCLAIVVSIGACGGGATVQATPIEPPMTPGGFGIGVWLGETSADKLVAVRDRAVELLSTLEWRSS